MTVTSPSLPAVPAQRPTPAVLPPGTILQRLARSDEASAQIDAAFRARHAPATQRNYDGWWNRFVNWCEDERTRSVDIAGLGEFSVMSLIPTTTEERQSEYPYDALERVLLVWLTSEFGGIVPDDADPDEWYEEHPSIAPATLNNLISAIRARVADRQPRLRWEPSTVFSGAVAGLRSVLGRRYGADRQATPLLLPHVERIARHLRQADEPVGLTADRVIFEMIAAGIDRAAIGRCSVDSYIPAGQHTVERHGPGDTNWTETAQVGNRLVIPGRRRRGGNQEPATVIDLDEQPLLRAALEQWLAVRPDQGTHLLGTTTSNLSQRIADSLHRTASSATVAWIPTTSRPNRQEAELIRRALDTGAGRDRTLVRRRDHAALLIGFFGALRRTEMCALRIGDLDFRHNLHGVRFVEVTIRQSKTDQRGSGQSVFLYNLTGSDTPPYLRVLDALDEWIQTLRNLGCDDSSPLLPAFERNGTPKRDAIDSHIKHLDPQDWSTRLRGHAEACEVFGPVDSSRTRTLYQRVRGHSLRRGFVTQAIRAKIDVIKIAKQTRHKSIQMLAVYADQLLAEEEDWGAALFTPRQPVPAS